MWPLKTIAYFIFFWVANLMALGNPVWGVVNYLAAYQMDPTDAWWGLPLSELGIRFSLYAAFFTMVGMVTGRKKVPSPGTGFGWWELGVVAIFLIGTMTTVAGMGLEALGRHDFEKFWKLLLFTLLIGRLAARRQNLGIILWTLVMGSLYIGYDASHAPPDAFVLGRLENIGGPDFSTTSGAAAHLSAMLPLIGAVFLIAPSWWAKLLAGAAGGLTVNAIIMCRTRSAFIGLVLGLLVAFLCAPRVRRFRIHALLVGAVVICFSLTDDHFWNRMGTLADPQVLQTDLATASRKEIWVASLQMLADHPLGIGVGNFTNMIGEYDPRHPKRSTHNSLIVCFVELGAGGGMVFLALVAGSLYMIHRSARLAYLTSRPLETRFLSYGMLISLVTCFATALGTQRFYCESFWWVLVFPIALHRIVQRECRRELDPALAGPSTDLNVSLLPALARHV